MLTMSQIEAQYPPIEPVVPLPETRFVSSPTDLPLQVPYTSLIEDAFIDNAVHLYNDRIRQSALHPVKLHAGQSAPANGGLGRFATPQPPEIIGGGLVGINI